MDGHQSAFQYRLAQSIRHGRASIFQEVHRGVAIRVKTRIGYRTARAAIKVYPIIAASQHPTWISLYLSGGFPRGRYQCKDPYRLRNFSGSHQDISHYRLAPIIWHSEPPSFMRLPEGVTIRVKTHISCGTARAAIVVYFIIGWL